MTVIAVHVPREQIDRVHFPDDREADR